MKPFFGIDLTENKENSLINGDEFLVEKTAEEEEEETLPQTEESEKPKEEAFKLPLALRIIRFISGALAIIAAVIIFRAISGYTGISIAEAYKNSPWLFWIGGGCLLLWIAICIIGSAKEKESSEDARANDEGSSEGEEEDIPAQLDIPDNAECVDILAFNYTDEYGEPTPVEKELALTVFFNISMKMFTDGKLLYLATTNEKYAFPLTSLKSILTVKKNILIPDWNKDVPPTKGVYLPYKLAVNNLECVELRAYHILTLEHNGEEWGIWFPSYELPAFEKLTGLVETSR